MKNQVRITAQVDGKNTPMRLENGVLVIDLPNKDIPDPPPIKDVRQWKGKFLAFGPNWDMEDDRENGDCGLYYPRYDVEKRARFRRDYVEAGYTHLPITVMRNNLPIQRLCTYSNELQDSGMVLCHMIFTDNENSPLPNDFNIAKRYVRNVIPAFANESHIVNCIGWEMPDTTKGSGEPIGDPPVRWGWTGESSRLIEMTKLIKKLAPNQPLYVHWKEDWWGCADIDDHRFADLFRDAGGTGILFQSRWADPNSHVFEQAFELQGPHDNEFGVCGRIENHGLDFVWFEFARHSDVHTQRLTYYKKDGRGRGYC